MKTFALSTGPFLLTALLCLAPAATASDEVNPPDGGGEQHFYVACGRWVVTNKYWEDDDYQKDGWSILNRASARAGVGAIVNGATIGTGGSALNSGSTADYGVGAKANGNHKYNYLFHPDDEGDKGKITALFDVYAKGVVNLKNSPCAGAALGHTAIQSSLLPNELRAELANSIASTKAGITVSVGWKEAGFTFDQGMGEGKYPDERYDGAFRIKCTNMVDINYQGEGIVVTHAGASSGLPFARSEVEAELEGFASATVTVGCCSASQ